MVMQIWGDRLEFSSVEGLKLSKIIDRPGP